jgi:cyclic peptide transporter
MELFQLLQKKSKIFYLFLALLGLINVVWSSALLLIINNKITGQPLPFATEYDWAIYGALIVVSYGIAKYFQSYMIKLTYELGNELGLSLFNKLRFSNYQDYLKLGEDKVRTAIADVAVLQKFPQTFIETFNATIMVLMGIVYLFWINPLCASLITGMMILLTGVYFLRNISIHKDLNTARDLANIYQQNVNDFLRGFKEIKTSIERSDNIYENYLSANRNKVKDLTIDTIIKYMGNQLLGNYALYFVIGVILFVMPMFLKMDFALNSSFIVTLLFLMGPIGVIVSEIREFTTMQVAVARLDEFDKTLSASEAIAIGHGSLKPINSYFQSIRFENVTFEYFDEQKRETFRLQPLNIEIFKGDSIFVTGGNGSGKSTFINLLTGLYTPLSGNIFLNGNLITPQNYPYYRNQIASIYTDNYLFSENYNDFDLTPSNDYLVTLINKMGLTDIIQLSEDNNKIRATLSKGQQKRMALIYAVLEQKDVLVLDEWAAEQDPTFRAFFYEKIVPELKKIGKTVVAVTHDDQFFGCGERLVKFDFGQIVSDVRVEAEVC